MVVHVLDAGLGCCAILLGSVESCGCSGNSTLWRGFADCDSIVYAIRLTMECNPNPLLRFILSVCFSNGSCRRLSEEDRVSFVPTIDFMNK